MLIGEYVSKVSAKKRVAVPKKFREVLGDELIVTRGYEGCLVLVDRERWEQITKEVTGGSFINKQVRDSGRFLLAGAHEVFLDEQGRFVLPDGLYEYADLNASAHFLGLSNWVEIWSDKKWKDQESYIKEHGDEIAQQLSSPEQTHES
ncbi:MAG: division/cell wall cluster transcriptional repressor MraZ [Candidatus Dojkabacteria bacterium]|nr:division/cell wall cluster transcriptional repressor MraZ [Candidatus Dojkabacteria bacterium]